MHPRPDDPRATAADEAAAAATDPAAADHAAADSIDTLDDLPLWSAPFGLRLLDAAARGPAAAVLDVGCGTGFPLVELAQRLMPRDRCVGVDPWRAALGRARWKAAAAATSARVVAAACEALPFRGASFDLIVSNNGFNNVTDIDASFRECARVAVPGARLLMTMNTAGTMRVLYDALRDALAERGHHASIEAMERHIAAKRPPVEDVRASLEAAGFGGVRIVEDAFTMRYANGTAFLSHAVIRRAFLPSWRAVIPGRDAGDVLSDLERRLNDVAQRDGCLTMDVPFVLVSAMRQ